MPPPLSQLSLKVPHPQRSSQKAPSTRAFSGTSVPSSCLALSFLPRSLLNCVATPLTSGLPPYRHRAQIRDQTSSFLAESPGHPIPVWFTGWGVGNSGLACGLGCYMEASPCTRLHLGSLSQAEVPHWSVFRAHTCLPSGICRQVCLHQVFGLSFVMSYARD